MSNEHRKYRRMGAPSWKAALRLEGKKGVENAAILKSYKAAITAEGTRSLSFTASTGAVDRDRDTLNPAGWVLDNFRKSPVVLWAHKYDELPLAKATDVRVVGKALKIVAEFAPADLNPMAESVYQMYRQGYLHAVSVGFDPREYAPAKAPDRTFGMDFLKQELVEVSCVPVPSNPEALIEARSKGIDTEPMVRWAEMVLADPAVSPLTKSSALRVAKALTPSKTYVDVLKDYRDDETVIVLDDDSADGSEDIGLENIPPMTTREQAESFAARLRRGTSHPTGYDQ